MVSLLAAFCLSNSAHAQSGPVNGGPVPAPPIYQAQPNAGLSEQALEAAIKALDPNCKVQLTDDQKGKVYSFVINRDGWAYNLRVTSFNNLMWLEASLSGPMSSPQNLPSATLRNCWPSITTLARLTSLSTRQRTAPAPVCIFVCSSLEPRLRISISA